MSRPGGEPAEGRARIVPPPSPGPAGEPAGPPPGSGAAGGAPAGASGAAPAGGPAGPPRPVVPPPASDPAAAVHALLRTREETVAVAESLTGGLLAAALTEMPGASATFRGGLVVYATDLKARLAGVPAPLLAAEGPVSPDVAAALAGGVRDRLGATYGLSLTGVAGPEPQDGKPVGTVYLGLAAPHGGQVQRLALDGDRAAIRAGAVAAALDLLLAVLTSAPSPQPPGNGEVSGADRESAR